jgi:hypothetical protein
MTKEQASQIPELQIHPDGLVEDCFYYRLAMLGRLSDEQGRKALDRLSGKEHDPCYTGAFIVADMMVHNIDTYGIPCIDWAD